MVDSTLPFSSKGYYRLREHGDLISPDGAFAAGPQSFLRELTEYTGVVILDAISLMRHASNERIAQNKASFPPSVSEFAELCKQADKRLRSLTRKSVSGGTHHLSKEENIQRLQAMCSRLGL